MTSPIIGTHSASLDLRLIHPVNNTPFPSNNITTSSSTSGEQVDRISSYSIIYNIQGISIQHTFRIELERLYYQHQHQHQHNIAINMSKQRSLLRETLELATCAALIYGCFIGYGYLHEVIYKRSYGPDNEKFTFSLFLVFCQSIGNILFASLLLLVMKQPPQLVPQLDYAKISFSYIGAMYCSNLALNFMSYPATSLAKSCKLIPVMIMSVLLLGKRYTIREYAQVLAITAGIALFMGAEEKKADGQATSFIGLGLCLLSLILDGFTGPTQERVNKEYKPSMAQMQFFLNLWSIAIVTVLLLVTGEFYSGLKFTLTHSSIIPEIALFSVLSAIGQAAILMTVLRFNSLILVTITTTRKLFTILFSVFMHGHPINATQWSGVALVFVGLMGEIVEKAQKKGHKKVEAKAH